jgi:sterol desaturase/sphingolipid hydroxylase (fatty acid hydroxylase superfamily)
MTLIALALGLLLWTLLEYLLHRFVFHARVLGARLAREHLHHHAAVSWFAPWWAKLLLAAPILSALAAVGVLLTGAPGGALALGTMTGWLAYEWLHRRIHVAAPRNAYARWARAHHLSHHFGRAHKNHGVTSPLWDWAFGTFEAPGVVGVPRAHALEFPWLVEAPHGAPTVRAAFAKQYRVV